MNLRTDILPLSRAPQIRAQPRSGLADDRGGPAKNSRSYSSAALHQTPATKSVLAAMSRPAGTRSARAPSRLNAAMYETTREHQLSRTRLETGPQELR